MRQYLFDIRDGGFTYDCVGVALASHDEARSHAVRVLRLQLAEQPDKFWCDAGWQVEVRDGAGLVLFTLAVMATDSPSMGRTIA